MSEAEQVRVMILCVNEIAETLNGNSFHNLPLIMDSSASGGLSPFWADFVDYQPSNIKLETAAHTNTVIGVGTLMWKFHTISGKTVFVPQVGYHMPKASVRLFSPQSYFRQFGGHGEIFGDNFLMHLADGQTIEFPVDKVTILPLFNGCSCSLTEKRAHGSWVC